jgi:transposase
MGRVIGLYHRLKKTMEDEARPTLVFIKADGNEREFALTTETDELDFCLGRYPTAWKSPEQDEDLSAVLSHHRKWRKTKTDEDFLSLPADWLQQDNEQTLVLDKVPSSYDGLQTGDVVAMLLGGSGDYLAYAMSRRGEEIGATIIRIPGYKLKEYRGGADADEKDPQRLVELYSAQPKLFHQVTTRDRDFMMLGIFLRLRQEALEARITATHRYRQSFIGQVFCKPNGLYPEGSLEAEFLKSKSGATVLKALETEERRRSAELEQHIETLPVYQNLFAPTEGLGPTIAAALLVAIGDIRRFHSVAALKQLCGVGMTLDGKFQRRRRGQVSNFSPDARQALYQFGDQMNRRPDSVWGRKLRHYKMHFRVVHPEPVVGTSGKKMYTNAHIHRMATWRTLTKFVEWLYREWNKLEQAQTQMPGNDQQAAD